MNNYIPLIDTCSYIITYPCPILNVGVVNLCELFPGNLPPSIVPCAASGSPSPSTKPEASLVLETATASARWPSPPSRQPHPAPVHSHKSSMAAGTCLVSSPVLLIRLAGFTCFQIICFIEKFCLLKFIDRKAFVFRSMFLRVQMT